MNNEIEYCSVFYIKDEKYLDTLKNWSNCLDKNKYILKEKYDEIEYCKNNRLCYMYYDGKNFIDPENFKIYSIKYFDMFPRCNINTYLLMRKDIEKYNGINIIKPYEYNVIIYWMKSVPQKYIKRNIEIFPSYFVSKNFKDIFNKYKNEKNNFFIKTLYKHWSYTGSLEGWYEGAAFGLELGNENNPIVFSDYLNIKEDSIDTLEYRGFYINGNLRSISRYTDTEEHTISQEVYEYYKELEKEVVGKYLPKSVVIDIGDTDKGLCIIECNDVSCSGRYLKNTCESIFESNYKM